MHDVIDVIEDVTAQFLVDGDNDFGNDDGDDDDDENSSIKTSFFWEMLLNIALQIVTERRVI